MKRRLLALALVLVMTFGFIPEVRADEISFVGVDKAVEKAIADEVTPGAQVVITKGADIVFSKAYGTLDQVTKTDTNTIYDLASVTKIMATTQAIMKLEYEGKIDLDATVATYIPEFAQNGKEYVKVRELLNHTSGLTPWKATYFHATTPKEELAYINALPLEYETGSARKYSDFSFMVLGYIVEAVTGKTLDAYTEQEIYKPLKMNNTVFTPLKKLQTKNIAPTSLGNPYEYKMVDDDNFGYLVEENAEDFKGWRNYRLIGEVNDGNSWYAQGGVAGHAGLFSTAEDLSILTRLMVNGGSFNGVKLYDKDTFERYTLLQSAFGHGYGYELGRGGASSGYMGLYATMDFAGHTGFTGTQFVIDKANGISVIILTNKQFFGVNEKGNYKSTWSMARSIMNAVYESGLVSQKYTTETVNVNFKDKLVNLSALKSDNRYFVDLAEFEKEFEVNFEKTQSENSNENVYVSTTLKNESSSSLVKTFVKNNKTYVHVRDLANILKLKVNYDEKNNLVTLSN